MRITKRKWDSLEGILNEIWTMLKRGVTHSFDPFHWPVLGTIGKAGCSMRTVILRQLILPDRILVCHTDSRAAKAQEISYANQVSWLFYHPKKKVQLRVTGQATLHTDDQFADEQWSNTKITSRLNYCTAEPPGTLMEKPTSELPDFLLNRVPILLESEKGRNNFMSIACRIDTIDWLFLNLSGNRRAQFVWHKNGFRSSWLVP